MICGAAERHAVMPPSAQPSVDDSADDELRLAQAQMLAQVLTRVGYAVWQAAELENTLAHYVVLRLRASCGVGEKRGIELLEKAQSRTFGHLLKELREAGIFEGSLEVRISSLLEERNWLVHRAKRENRGILNDMRTFDALVERLDRMGAEATQLNTLLGKELERFVIASGVDQKYIDEEAAAFLQRWGY